MVTSSRVVARYLEAETQLLVRDEGQFILEYLPKHAEVVEPIVEKVHKAIAMYQSAGLPVKHKFLARLHGRGAAHADALYWEHTNPPLMVIAPKAYRDPILVKTIVHELGHYTHDKVVPGGMSNYEVKRRYSWALRQKATGEGPQLDVLKRKMFKIEQEIKVLEEDQYIRRSLPRKGAEFDFTFWDNGKAHTLTGRIVGKSGQKVDVEVLKAPPLRILDVYRKLNGHPVIDRSVSELTYEGTKPGYAERIKEMTAQRHELYEASNAIARTEKHDTYEAQRHEWVPTAYSRKNVLEWFAELCTTYVLGHLKKPVDDWLISVIRTGEAPKELAWPAAQDELSAQTS
jgi:hypothetical protein